MALLLCYDIHMRAKNQPLLTNFDLIIFDFDGTIADSLRSYRKLDQQLIKELYGVWEEIDKIIEFRDKSKANLAVTQTTNTI